MTSDPEGFVQSVAALDLPLAARCANSPEVEVGEALAGDLRQELLARSRDPAADLRARIEAGLALGTLGDPRFEAREGHAGTYLVPPLVSIPGGRYPIGSREGDADERPPHRPQPVPLLGSSSLPSGGVEWGWWLRVVIRPTPPSRTSLTALGARVESACSRSRFRL